MSQATVQFKGNRYSVIALQKQAGPVIAVKPEELHLDNNTLVEIAGDAVDLVTPIFAKYEGKYVLLLARGATKDQVAEGKTIKGKLLSNPTLKRAVITA